MQGDGEEHGEYKERDEPPLADAVLLRGTGLSGEWQRSAPPPDGRVTPVHQYAVQQVECGESPSVLVDVAQSIEEWLLHFYGRWLVVRPDCLPGAITTLSDVSCVANEEEDSADIDGCESTSPDGEECHFVIEPS